MTFGLVKFGAELASDAVTFVVKSALGLPTSKRDAARQEINRMVKGLHFSFDFDDSEVRRMIYDVEHNIVPKATVRALNKVAQQARSAVIKEVSLITGLKQKLVRQNVGLARANRNNFTAVIQARGKPVPLINFGARQLKKGVSAKVGAQRKVYKSAFIKEMPGGHRGVFVRRSKNRLPIREMYGPSVPSGFINERSISAMDNIVQTKLAKIFEHASFRYVANDRAQAHGAL